MNDVRAEPASRRDHEAAAVEDLGKKRVLRTAKELTRHLLHSLGWRRKLPHLQAESREERFARIYEAGVWRLDDPNSPASGWGSSLAATELVRRALPALLERLSAETLLDVGCGDFTWMKDVALSCAYVGIDIVPSIIAANRDAYGSPRRTFMLCDAVKETLPEADVVLCREVLFHLSFADAIAALKNIFAGDRRYLITTTDHDTAFNSDIETGDFRLVNLEKRPFRLPPPLFEIGDSAVAKGRRLGVWNMAEVRASLDGGKRRSIAAAD